MKPAMRRSALAVAAILVIHAVLWRLAPRLAAHSLANGLSGLAAIAAILPPILVLLALFDAWVPRQAIETHLGPGSGIRGIILAVLLGTASAGPLYAAFPAGLALLRKGARVANLTIFLGSWATIKIPMLLMEGAFLGLRFALIRLALTLPGIIGCGLLLERLCQSIDTGNSAASPRP